MLKTKSQQSFQKCKKQKVEKHHRRISSLKLNYSHSTDTSTQKYWKIKNSIGLEAWIKCHR